MHKIMLALVACLLSLSLTNNSADFARGIYFEANYINANDSLEEIDYTEIMHDNFYIPDVGESTKYGVVDYVNYDADCGSNEIKITVVVR